MKRAAIALAATMAMPAVLQAETADIPFSATIAGTCFFSGGTPGTLAVDGTLQNLNSLSSPGTISVTTTSSGYNVSLDTPTLTKPVSDTTPLNSIGGAIHMSGATTMNRFDTDAPYPLNVGKTDMNVYFFAGKNGTNIFMSGTYTTQMTVRCE